MQKSSKLKNNLIRFFLIFAIFSLIGYLGYKNLRGESLKIAEISSGGSVSLSLSPLDPILKPGEESIVSLKVDSGSDKLTLVKFEITYDPAKVTVSALNMGAWLTQPLVAPTISNGKISGIIGAKPDPDIANGGPELSRTGAGTLLSFKVKASNYGTYPITINQATTEALTMSNVSSTPNMLKAVTDTNLLIKLATDLVGTTHKVDAFDFGEFISQYGHATGTADFNNKDGVNAYDFGIFIADYGKTW